MKDVDTRLDPRAGRMEIARSEARPVDFCSFCSGCGEP